VIGVAAAMVIGAADWVAVGRNIRRAEAALKPLVPLPLIGVALAAHAWWFAIALALCLAGDVLLLPQVDRFRSGLAAFLLGHLAFIGGFAAMAWAPGRLLLGAPVAVVALLAAPRIALAAPPRLRAPIIAYTLVIVAMFAASWMPHRFLAQLGASLFVLSDFWLAWNRFVKPVRGGRVGVIVTYHLAIGLLTLSLLF